MSGHATAPALHEELIALKLPQTLRIRNGTFQLVDHDGRLLIGLSAAELIAVSQFVQPTLFSDGLQGQRALLMDSALDEARLAAILSSLSVSGMLSLAEPTVRMHIGPGDKRTLKENIARHAVEHEKAEELRRQQTGVYRTKVIPVAFGDAIPSGLDVG
jgi:hypothetical protein